MGDLDTGVRGTWQDTAGICHREIRRKKMKKVLQDNTDQVNFPAKLPVPNSMVEDTGSYVDNAVL
jgi:hypothetical protein